MSPTSNQNFVAQSYAEWRRSLRPFEPQLTAGFARPPREVTTLPHGAVHGVPAGFHPTCTGPAVRGALLRVLLRGVLRASYPPLRASYPPLSPIPKPGTHAVHSLPLVTWILHPVTARSKAGLGTTSTSWWIGNPATRGAMFFSIRLSSARIRRSSSLFCLSSNCLALVLRSSTQSALVLPLF